MDIREKVVKGLECCIIHNPDGRPRCTECPYEGACLNRLKNDALTLINRLLHPWIPVDQMLPPDDMRVLCLTRTKKGTYNAIVGYHADDRWCCGMNSNVTHWMPVPELPEEG